MPHVNFVFIENILPAIPTKCVQKKSRKCILLASGGVALQSVDSHKNTRNVH